MCSNYLFFSITVEWFCVRVEKQGIAQLQTSVIKPAEISIYQVKFNEIDNTSYECGIDKIFFNENWEIKVTL